MDTERNQLITDPGVFRKITSGRFRRRATIDDLSFPCLRECLFDAGTDRTQVVDQWMAGDDVTERSHPGIVESRQDSVNKHRQILSQRGGNVGETWGKPLSSARQEVQYPSKSLSPW